jgi:hypothetical protein
MTMVCSWFLREHFVPLFDDGVGASSAFKRRNVERLHVANSSLLFDISNDTENDGWCVKRETGRPVVAG